jgi:ABC-2 type transport system ATP-binding protein
MKARALRRLEIQFARPVPPGAFHALPGIRSVHFEGQTGQFEVEGSVDDLVKAAARFEVVGIRSHEPNLEEIFLAYYDDNPKRDAR